MASASAPGESRVESTKSEIGRCDFSPGCRRQWMFCSNTRSRSASAVANASRVFVVAAAERIVPRVVSCREGIGS
jgi:hypothetical protein